MMDVIRQSVLLPLAKQLEGGGVTPSARRPPHLRTVSVFSMATRIVQNLKGFDAEVVFQAHSYDDLFQKCCGNTFLYIQSHMTNIRSERMRKRFHQGRKVM